MEVVIYAEIGSERRKVWEGLMMLIPCLGEEVVIDGEGSPSYKVVRITHWLADSCVEIYVR
jgi:hypothetical protein